MTAFLLVVGAFNLGAQQSYPLRLHLAPADEAAFERWRDELKPRPTGEPPVVMLPDSSAFPTFAATLLDFFRSRAHLTASLDTVRRDSASAEVWLHLGPTWRLTGLRAADSATAYWLRAIQYRPKRFDDRPLDPATLVALEKSLLEAAENNGYPFAAVRLDSIAAGPDGAVDAVLRLTPNRYFRFGDLRLAGNVRLPKAYLSNYLGLRAGQPYSRARVLALRDQLGALLFAEPSANPTITFAGEEAAVNIFLEKKRASRFDFIIGLLPRTATATAPASGVLVTGSLNAAFLNALNLGERLAVEFERLRPETQKLDAQAGLPYVFGTSFGVEGRLNIFRRDTTWVDAQTEFGVQYLFAGADYVKFFWENRSLILQKVDTATVRRTRVLPASLDQRQNGFGLEGAWYRLDYRFNPRRGIAWFGRGIAGFNRVLRNSAIEAIVDPGEPDFRYASLYDTATTRVARFRLEGRAEAYLPLFARTTLKLGIRSAGIFSEKPVYANEQYRLGGNKLLRGFDEESLFATRYAVATAELRLLTGRNSYLAVFTDYGYVENLTTHTRVFLRPWGFGAGLTFETRAGIFGINLAVGRPDAGQSVDFRAAKFHLGYVSLF